MVPLTASDELDNQANKQAYQDNLVVKKRGLLETLACALAAVDRVALRGQFEGRLYLPGSGERESVSGGNVLQLEAVAVFTSGRHRALLRVAWRLAGGTRATDRDQSGGINFIRSGVKSTPIAVAGSVSRFSVNYGVIEGPQSLVRKSVGVSPVHFLNALRNPE
jgi:hypothetical protein